MDISLDLKISLEQNASLYYDKSKKAKKKLEGTIKALNESKLELERLEADKEKAMVQIELDIENELGLEERKDLRKSYWYDKFRWFFTSNGMLCVGGRDATSNDIIVKKYMDKDDLVFHTEAPGSPFFLLKTGGEEVSDEILEEVAIATASFSRSWKSGLGSAEVFCVNPDQVSKESVSAKGAFMVRGKRNILRVELGLGIGVLEDGRLMCGPLSSVESNCADVLKVVQGRDKKSDFSRKIRAKIGGDDEEVMHILPAGEFGFG